MSPASSPAAAPPLPGIDPRDLDDIQGLILRGYRRMRRARHLFVHVERPEAFRSVLGDLAIEDRASGPFVTVASDWRDKPPVGEDATHCVNVGLTYEGLEALGVAPASLATFPAEFRAGAAQRAARVGDTGASDPATWIEPLNPAAAATDALHVVLSLFAVDGGELDALSADLRARVERDGAGHVLLARDAGALYDDPQRAGYVHFGYRDGLSQPTIAGLPTAFEDPLDPVPLGEFVLGHGGQRPASNPVPQPAALGHNGSFAALRIAEQDVAAFETFLDAESDGTTAGRELLAARLCGRWRSGVPLVMAPDADAPQPSAEDLNRFDYAAVEPDPDGRRCPLGSHIRRTNPRRHPVMGGAGDKHRLIRRGMPYGPPFHPQRPDGAERGLVGMFICASLRNQFEFVMKEWVNDGMFAAGLGRTKDPLCGANEPPDGAFGAPGDPPLQITGLSSFVTTRGAAYLFLPSMTALRHLADLR